MTEEFKIFLEYYKRVFKVDLLESPSMRKVHDPHQLNNSTYNIGYAEEIIRTVKPGDSIVDVTINLTRYSKPSEVQENNINDIWITSEPRVEATFTYHLLDGGIKFDSVWNSTRCQGCARRLIFNKYLKEFDFIESDSNHSQFGKEYWRKLTSQSTKEGYPTSVIDLETNSEVDFKLFPFEQNYNNGALVFRIYKK